jgi:cellobiose transport system substrate-binding protein
MVPSRFRRPHAGRVGAAQDARRAGSRPLRLRRLVAATAATVLVLAGCAGQAEAPTVTFWSFTGIQQGKQVERYLDTHPGARIELSEIGTSSETADALTAALAGGRAPDLVLIQAEDLPRFAAVDEHFLDLREFAGPGLSDEYLTWAWDGAVTASGKVIGIPTDVGGMALAYRADLFEQVGLPVEPDEVAALWPTWEDFVDVGSRFVGRSDAAFVDNVSTTVFVNASNQLPTKYYDSSGQLVHDRNADLRDAFDLAIAAHASGISAGVGAFTPGWSAAMARGDFAVMAAPSWMLRVIKSTAPESSGRWRVTSVPGVAGNWGGSYLAIPAGSRHPEAAWEYIAHTQSPTAQNDHFVAGGPLPATVAPYDGEDVSSFGDPFFGSSRIGAVLTQSIRDMASVRQGPASATISAAFVQTLTGVEQGSIPAADAWGSALEAAAVALPAASGH